MPRQNPSVVIQTSRRKYTSVTVRFHWPWSNHLASATSALHPCSSQDPALAHVCDQQRDPPPPRG
jgi:hypothetical protein